MTAQFYDATYSAKDYAAEARCITGLIRKRKQDAETLLDVACGTGRHLQVFATDGWHCEGVDLDPAMLEIARKRVPRVPLTEADMVTMSLGRMFDAVVCMFSSIGYTRTVNRMRSAVTAMASHLNAGGVLIVEPWITPETWTAGKPGLDLARIKATQPAQRGRLVMEYMLGTSAGVEHLREGHNLGWFTHDEYAAAFKDSNLQVEHVPAGDGRKTFNRGLYIGISPH